MHVCLLSTHPVSLINSGYSVGNRMSLIPFMIKNCYSLLGNEAIHLRMACLGVSP